MSRQLVAASSQYVEINSNLFSTPLSVSCWFYPDDATSAQALVGFYTAALNTNYLTLFARGDTAGDPVQFQIHDGAGNSVDTTTGFTAGAWHHACGVSVSAAERHVFLNGGGKATTTVSRAPTGMDRATVGRFGGLASGSFVNGRVAEVGVWNVALDDAEVAALAKGVSPLLIRPAALVAYWPFLNSAAPDVDRWKNRHNLTPTNAPTMGEHPRMFYPTGPRTAPSANAFTILAAAGSYALTGSAATFRRTYRMVSDAGVYVVTGVVANLKSARKLVAAIGSYAATGVAATLVKGRRLFVDVGSYAVTGTAATFRRALKLTAAIGSYVVTGVAAILRKTNPTSITVVIGSSDLTPGIDLTTLAKEESNDTITSNTCRFDYYGDTPPSELQEIVITRGISGREFAGTVLDVKQFYNGIRHNLGWRITCQDFTWLFNDGRYSYKWDGAVSASTIAAAIVAFKSGFTSTNVQAALATVTDFEIINKTRGEALKLLGDRVGATTVKVDYTLDVHFRVTASAVDLPTDITDLTRSGDELLRDSEAGQIRTRQRGLGVRVRIPALIPAGSTTLAVESVDKLPASGQLQVGSRTLTFTAQTQTQTPAGVAGIAAAPTVALASTPAGGVLGAVRYCITFETPDGETPPGTQSAQVTGATIAAPSAGAAAIQHGVAGAGSTGGDSYIGVVTLSRSGTTLTFALSPALVVGARVNIHSGATGSYDGTWTVGAVSGTTHSIYGVSSAGPATESAAVQYVTAGPFVGTWSYKLGWISPLGISALSTAFGATGAADATTFGLPTPTETTGGSMTAATYKYWYTVSTEAGEGAPIYIGSWALTGANTALSFSPMSQIINHDMRLSSVSLYRSVANGTIPRLLRTFSRGYLRSVNAFGATWGTYLDTAADASLGALPVSTELGAAFGLSSLPAWSDGRVTGLAILRNTQGGSTYYLHTILSSSLSSFLDTMSDATLLQQSPVPVDAFGGHSVTLTSIALGAAGTTARNIYRLFNGVWRYCGTLADNTTTTFTDKKADTELGAPIKIAGYLTGITATTADIVAGEVGRLHVVRNDAAAQAIVLAALGRGDGVIEGPLVDDDTMTQTALEAACDAELVVFGSALRSVTFRSRGLNLDPGKTITITLGGTTNISGTFLIQKVLSSEFERAEGLYPLRKVTAGPVLATLRKTLGA